MFNQKGFVAALRPYLALTQAVRQGDLVEFNSVVKEVRSVFVWGREVGPGLKVAPLFMYGWIVFFLYSVTARGGRALLGGLRLCRLHLVLSVSRSSISVGKREDRGLCRYQQQRRKNGYVSCSVLLVVGSCGCTVNHAFLICMCMCVCFVLSCVVQHDATFRADKTYTLIQRLAHNVIKTGLRKINSSYSRVSLQDLCEKVWVSWSATVEPSTRYCTRLDSTNPSS